MTFNSSNHGFDPHGPAPMPQGPPVPPGPTGPPGPLGPPAPLPSQGLQKKKRAWLVPTVTGVVALLIGVSIGAAGQEVDNTDSLQASQEEMEALTQERDELQGAVADLEAAVESADATSQESQQVEAAREEALEKQQAELDAVAEELDGRLQELDEREAQLTGAEEKEKAGTFGEGRWVVGEDIEPGVYKTVEPVTSSSCYWAITTSGSNGSDIIANDFATKGNHTVTVKGGQDFESSSCGQWKLQG